jgi:hypothetical protein
MPVTRRHSLACASIVVLVACGPRVELEWDVLREESGDWIVCNGLRFGLTAPDSLITWRPSGASAEAARALADSIAAHR